MLSRHDINDDHWGRIAHLLPGQAGGHGGVGNDTRLSLNAVRYLAGTPTHLQHTYKDMLCALYTRT